MIIKYYIYNILSFVFSPWDVIIMLIDIILTSFKSKITLMKRN